MVLNRNKKADLLELPKPEEEQSEEAVNLDAMISSI